MIYGMSSDIKSMIADYMEKGFLENIIDMFKNDHSLYCLVGELINDERMRVRLGTAALVETLSKDDPDNIANAVPGIAAFLKSDNPTIRGDAAYLLGITGSFEAMPFLAELADDDNLTVREIVREAIEEIKVKGS